jgi:hypothetical protein
VLTGIASVKSSLRTWWTDESLYWDPLDFGGVTSLRMPTRLDSDDRAWTPDIVIREDAGGSLQSNLKYTDLTLFYDGSFFNDAYGDVLVVFSPLIDFYPYDKQNITITFGSSSYDNKVMPVVPHDIPFLFMTPESFNQSNIEWEDDGYNFRSYNETSEVGT